MTVRGLVLAALTLLAAACGRGGSDEAATREAAYRENNLGVAALEQHAHEEAVAAFRRAITLDPRVDLPHLNLAIALYYASDLEAAATASAEAVRRRPESPHAAFVQGLIARSRNQTGEAVAAFERVLRLDAEDVGALVNLGQIELQERRVDRAIEHFRAAVAREPFNATAAYGLGQALLRSGASDDGASIMARFETLRASGAAITYSQTYLEQGRYAEALVSTGLEPDLVDRAPPRVRFADQTAAWAPAALTEAANRAGVDASLLADLDGDGVPELVVARESAAQVFRWDGRRFAAASTFALAANPSLGPVLGVTAADLGNDGRADLLWLHERGLSFSRQERDGTFVAGDAPRLMPGRLRTAAMLDVDHDGDLDVLAGGADLRAGEHALVLLQNDGTGALTDITTAATLPLSVAATAMAPTDFDNGRDIDVLVLAAGRAPALFANQRDGTFRDVGSDAGLGSVHAGLAVAAGDFNKDGRTDFFITHQSAPASVALSTGRDRFVVTAAADSSQGLVAAQAADYDNDGLLDVVGVGARGVRIFRNVGARFEDVTAQALGGGAAGVPLTAFALADIDGDGDLDLAAIAESGALHLFRNDGGSTHPALAVGLRGLVSNRSGVGARVDVRAGSLWQRLEVTAVTPAIAPQDPRIGLGGRQRADVVRVLWPAGIVQAETLPAEPAVGSRVLVAELDRKPSSCPYLYTWNGDEFEFVTDFLGGGEMGYWTGAHGWNTPDSDEFVRIAERQLRARDGRLELRVTNELEEVLYLDQLRLLSVDHPTDVEVYPREGMRARAATALSLVAVRQVRPVLRAVTDRGDDVTARVARRDGRSAEGFVPRPIRGYAEPHSLILDLPATPPGSAPQVLLLTGWTDYAFSSDNVAAAQRGWALEPPRLEMRVRDGAWQPLVPDVGIPVGRPQTIVVDIERAADAGATTLRLVTNMRIHWDAIAVADRAVDVHLVLQVHPLESATLAWRGYSDERRAGTLRVPDYSRVSASSPWKVFPGRYTREGDVHALLSAADDGLVVARTGDEVALTYRDVAGRAARPGGRTFLLHAVGYSKEMDPNSASPDHVLPWPFRAMRAYPPGPAPAAVEARQREVADRYNTRVVTRTMPAVPAPGASSGQEPEP